MVADLQLPDAGTDLLHDARALVPADDGQWRRKIAGTHVVIRVT